MASMNENPGIARGNRIVMILGGIVVAIAAITGLSTLLVDGPNVAKTTPGSLSEVIQRPTGAGTVADGVADEPVESLTNQTATDDFVDSSAAADTTGVEPEGDHVEPATSASGLEPAVGDGNVERMSDEAAPTSGN